MEISLQVSQREDWDVVSYQGPINEETEIALKDLPSRLGEKCIFNFRNVSFVNSCGVRGWINFLRVVEKGRQLIFEECTSEIVMQMNMIPNFRSSATIRSVYGSYFCEDCNNAVVHLFEAGKNLPANRNDEIEVVVCSQCGADMEMEELEEEFFAFLG